MSKTRIQNFSSKQALLILAGVEDYIKTNPRKNVDEIAAAFKMKSGTMRAYIKELHIREVISHERIVRNTSTNVSRIWIWGTGGIPYERGKDINKTYQNTQASWSKEYVITDPYALPRAFFK